MQAAEILAGANATNVAAAWDDAHRYTPAPRHRRRLILKMLAGLDFADCLDAGCAQPSLLQADRRAFRRPGFRLRHRRPGHRPKPRGPARLHVPGGRPDPARPGRASARSISSSVRRCSRHLADWKAAVANLVRMARKELLITVPSGPIRAMDQMVGHLQHFQGPELCAALEVAGL